MHDRRDLSLGKPFGRAAVRGSEQQVASLTLQGMRPRRFPADLVSQSRSGTHIANAITSPLTHRTIEA